MNRRVSFLFAAILLTGSTVALSAQDGAAPAPVASGKPSGDYDPAEGLENWRYETDLGAYKPGTYNIIVRVTDVAGNISLGGPFNIVIDPASDLALTRIAHPLPFMRVGADLNVVGTSVDDDGVDHVEISIDGGDWKRAQGGAYWSYYLATAELEDGLHTLRARAVDIHGLEGKIDEVRFHLDRTKPLNTVNQPSFGTLVSGRLALGGTVYDANQVRSLSYSIDDGVTWKPLKIKLDKGKTGATFSLAVDTRKMDDGPAVVWFKGVDGVGSEGVSVFLYFVDNTKPELELYEPVAGAALNGRFALSGRVFDTVGLSSLSWSYGKETGSIELVPGNPYFSLELDAGMQAGKASLRLSALDVAGNVSSLDRSWTVDPRADLPRLTVLRPLAGERVEGKIQVYGSAVDDDGVARIQWKIDNGEIRELETDGPFSFEEAGVSVGKRVLSVRAVDKNGVPGLWSALPLQYIGDAPAISFERVSDASGGRAFVPGMTIDTLDGKASILVRVEAPNGIAELSYTLNDGLPVPLKVAKTQGAIELPMPLPAGVPFGAVRVSLRAKDAEGKESVISAPVYATNYAKRRQGPLLDAGAFVPGDRIAIRSDSPYRGAFVQPYADDALVSVALEPASPYVKAQLAPSGFTIEHVKDGISQPTLVTGTTSRGHRLELGPFTFVSDATPPSMEIVEPAFNSWHKDSISLKLRVQDQDAVEAVEYRLAGGDWTGLTPANGLFEARLNVAGIDAGAAPAPVLIELRARDKAGNEARAVSAAMADTTAPALERLSPRDGDALSGARIFSVRIAEPAWSVASVEVLRGSSSERLPYAPIVFFRADAGESGALAIRVTDKAGNIGELDLKAGLNQDAGLKAPPDLGLLKNPPATENAGDSFVRWAGSDAVGSMAWTGPTARDAYGPELEASLAAPVRVSGSLSLNVEIQGVQLDPKKPEAYWGYTPDSAAQPLALKPSKTGAGYEAALKLPALPDGSNAVWLRLRDTLAGDRYAVLPLDADSTPPALEVVSPKGAQSGSFTLLVRAADANGIRSISYEAGADKGDFDLPAGSGYAARSFSFPEKAKALTIALRATDGSGNVARTTLTVNYDQAADTPSVRVLYPAAGAVRSDGSSVIAFAFDDDGVASVSMALDGQASGAEGAGPLFSIDPGAVKSGAKAISLAALDLAGLPSARATLSYTQAGAGPSLRPLGVQLPKAALAPFEQGMATVVEAGSVFQASAEAPNGLASAEYSLSGGDWIKLAVPAKPDASGSYTLSAALPPGLPFDRFTLALRARDAYGMEASWNGSLYRVAPARGETSDLEGITVLDARAREDGSFLLKPGEELGALWNGRPVASLALEPAWPGLEASYDASSVRLLAVGEGRSPSLSIVVTTVDGDKFKSVPLRVDVDAEEPSVMIERPPRGAWLGSTLELSGKASDANGIAELAWSVDDGLSWTAIPAGSGSGPRADLPFTLTVPLDIPDGPGALVLRARDTAGRETHSRLDFHKDTVAPRMELVAPGPEATVNGIILLRAHVLDAGSIEGLAYTADGELWQELPFLPVGATALAGKEGYDPARDQVLSFGLLVDLGALGDLGALAFAAVDKAGNRGEYRPLAGDTPAFTVDNEGDKPRSYVQIPFENEVMRSDFVVSGMAFDDDGIAEIRWRVDGGEWIPLDGANAFSVPFSLRDVADNEHLFEVYAVDLNGVAGDIAARNYRVSREEPVGKLLKPEVSVTNRGAVVLSGEASDANGIKEVWLSFDNGNSYNRAAGTLDWSYALDTKLLADGVHSVYLKLVDGYDTPGFAAGLITVDNTAPTLALTGPFDGDEFVGSFVFGGRVSDAVGVETLGYEFSAIGSSAPALTGSIGIAEVFSRSVDISSLVPGWYNLKVTALDRAKNASYDSRNVLVRASQQAESAVFYFPAQGEPVSGRFTLDGRVLSSAKPKRAQLKLGGQPLATVELNEEGWFSVGLDGSMLDDGELTFTVEAPGRDGATIVSEPRTLLYEASGPWVDIEGYFTGDFVSGRPFLSGSAGWPSEAADKSDKAAWAAYQKLLKQRALVAVDVSRDNGRTFEPAKGLASFRYRLETQEYPNGELRLIVRARFANGQSVVRKRIVTIDTKKPAVEIARPSENGRFNGALLIEGTASDETGLSSVEVALRSGDKASYEVPGFIQGSFLDLHTFGATRFEAGMGLSFFEDNVKLQLNFGKGFDAMPTWDNVLGFITPDTTPGDVSRFGGYVLGFKLLANLAYLPFGYFFGPDWDFFSMSFAMGASFTYFSQTGELGSIFSPTDGKYMVLSGVVGQWEFAKFSFNTTFLKSVGLYLEGGLIFIPSEASTSLEEFIRPNVAFGMRLGLF